MKKQQTSKSYANYKFIAMASRRNGVAHSMATNASQYKNLITMIWNLDMNKLEFEYQQLETPIISI